MRREKLTEYYKIYNQDFENSLKVLSGDKNIHNYASFTKNTIPLSPPP